MRIGYARVSSVGQNLESQLFALRGASCDRIREEKASAKSMDRKELEAVLDWLSDGDTLVVTKLDRLARSTKDLLNIAERIEDKGAGLEILNIQLDTSTPTGKLMLTMLGAIAQFERELMLERQAEGIAEAKREGKYRGGKAIDQAKLTNAQTLIDSGLSIKAAAKAAGMSRSMYYKAQAEGRI
jgi:DNA invertase Pin-like site-specific DNA recombinase